MSEEELGIWLPIEELGMKSILGLLLLCEKITLTSTSCMSSGSSGSEKRSTKELFAVKTCMLDPEHVLFLK